MENFNYSPEKNGAVVAIRIFYSHDRQPMAQLAFAFGGTVTINWTCPAKREQFAKGINGYTFIYDERAKPDFSSLVKNTY